VVYGNISLGYDDLKSILLEVRRHRSRHFSGNDWIHKKLLEACVDFAKHGLKIVDNLVINRLCVAFRALRITRRRLRILLDGEAKALEMQVQYRTRGVFKWAPLLQTWLKTENYRFWLGTIQGSLSNHACPEFQIMGNRPDER
jgi:hypothetical protein